MLKEISKKTKIFLSHRMSGLTIEEVEELRNKAIATLDSVVDYEYVIIENFWHYGAPEDAGKLWHLGRSIQQMGEADMIYFVEEGGNKSIANGCKVEKLICHLYGLKYGYLYI